MVSSLMSKDKQFNEVSFNDYLVDTCKQHKAEGKAFAFAFIIYDSDNHTINQILVNKDYWNSLDKISGDKLSVFYINSRDSYYKKRQEEIYQKELKERKNNYKNGHFSYLVPLVLEPTPLDNAIDFIKNTFELEDSLETPFILFFQIDEENISDSFVIGLKQDRLEDAFLELRDIIKNSITALSKVKVENISNHQEIFSLIKGGVEQGKFYEFIKKKVTSKIGIGTIITFIKLIVGAS